MITRFGIVAALSKPEAADLGDHITRWLENRGHTVIQEADITNGALVDVIIVLGGDGLMMRAANTYPNVPLLGINFGKVGFLALVEQQEWTHALDDLTNGRYEVEDSSTLSATLQRDGTVSDENWAINDVVIRSGSRMLDIEVYIDQSYVNTYPGDGMIVSTPHGSTAYCMAAGGPILTYGVRGFAVVPISCHSPMRTPMVASESALIELVILNDHEGALILDGRTIADIQKGDTIQVTRGSHSFRLIRVQTSNFYEAVRAKFNFQIRPDATPSRLAGVETPSNHAGT